MLKQLPNALTLLRLILAPVIALQLWTLFTSPGAESSSGIPTRIEEIANGFAIAAALFVAAALTDLFDGMLARALNAHSKFGRLIDPIADKALVGLPLLVIAFGTWRNGPFPEWLLVVIATATIVGRDVLMTVWRLVAPDGEGVPVSSLAKWKTALELVVVGSFLIAGAILAQFVAYAMRAQPQWAGDANSYVEFLSGPLKWLWISLLVLAAALSAYTAWLYLAPRSRT